MAHLEERDSGSGDMDLNPRGKHKQPVNPERLLEQHVKAVPLLTHERYERGVRDLLAFGIYSRNPSKMIALFEEWASHDGNLSNSTRKKAQRYPSRSPPTGNDNRDQLDSPDPPSPRAYREYSISEMRALVRQVLLYEAWHRYLLPLDSAIVFENLAYWYRAHVQDRPHPARSLGAYLDEYIPATDGLRGLVSGQRIAWFTREAGWFGPRDEWSQGIGTILHVDDREVVIEHHKVSQSLVPEQSKRDTDRVKLLRDGWSNRAETWVWIHKDDIHLTRTVASQETHRQGSRNKKKKSKPPTTPSQSTAPNLDVTGFSVDANTLQRFTTTQSKTPILNDTEQWITMKEELLDENSCDSQESLSLSK